METSFRHIHKISLSPRVRLIIVDIISYIFILLFLHTALDKIWKFNNFRQVLGFMPLLGSAGNIIAYVVPAAEITISALLIIPSTRKWGLAASLTMMLIFTSYLVFMIFYTDDLPCNCGGVISQLTWTQHIWFNSFFVLLGIVGFRLSQKYR